MSKNKKKKPEGDKSIEPSLSLVPQVKPEETQREPEPTPLYEGKGILIVALGAPEYGRMAANLASSIRYIDQGMKIHMVWSGQSISHLSEEHKALFTSMAECPPEYYTKHGKTVYIKAKTCIYELSPFEETIFLDADMIWFSGPNRKNASSLFEELKDVELTFQHRGYFDLSRDDINERYSNWCNIAEVKEKYFDGSIGQEAKEAGFGRYYHLHSEFIFFKRSESNKAFFDLCREIFDNPKVKPALFDGDIPDELAFDIAVAVTGKNPHKDSFLPIHWYAIEGRANLNQIQDKFYGISMGGNNLPPSVMDKYKMLAKFYARALKLPHSFSITPKKRWSPNRKAA